MPEAEVTAYKYSIPLEDDEGTESPTYSTPDMSECLDVTYAANHYVIVVEDAIPQLHKDSVNVGVQEVPIGDFTSGTENGGEN